MSTAQKGTLTEGLNNMVHLIIELGKYLNIILIAFYTLCSLRVIGGASEKHKKHLYIIMTVLFFALHFSCSLQLYVNSMDTGIIMFYVAQLAIFILVQILYRKCYKRLSGPVFRNMMLLIMIGLVILTRLDFMTALRQFFIMTIMLALGLVVPVMIEKFQVWGRLGLVYVLIGLGVMVFLLLTGSEVHGATNWIVIGGFRFQPSELVKLLYVFGMASLLARSTGFKSIVLTTGLAAAHVIVLVLERDLGAALLFFLTYVVMLYTATRKIFYLIAGLVSGAVASVAAYYIFSHVQTRVQIFLDPFATYESGGYQVAQSLFAIGTGGWFGTGLGQGIPNTIPVAQSDFIFAALSEEMGGIFCICLILIVVSCFIMFINISIRIKDLFFKLVALGFGVLYITQVLLNIGGATKFIPLTGVTLPLVSAGGTSLIATIIMFNVIQGMYSREPGTVSGAKSEGIKKSDNRILALTYIFSAAFLGLIVYYGGYIGIGSREILKDSRNTRQSLLEAQIIRGDIYTSDGKVLATTSVADDGTETRVYPFDRMYSHVVGRNSKGKTGVELLENTELLTSDINGLEKLTNSLNDVKNPGNNVVTTLDSRLQEAAYKALGDNRGAVVVMEPSTGRILAMVSKPDYNPNTVDENWDSLNADSDERHALLNRATQGLYQPGSTFKILTLLEYMRENDDYEDYSYVCRSEDRYFDVTIHCAGGIVHGSENLKESFANSCNSSFAHIGSGLDMDKMNALSEDFLFNKSLPGSFGASGGSFVLSGDSNSNDIPQSIIGLSTTLTTPLHNALIVSTIANDGVMMTPYVVDHIENANGQVVRSNSQRAYKTIISVDEADILTEYMEAVVEDGTASKLKNLDMNIAGKTGTATYDTSKPAHAWFVGFAPADNPQIVVSVLVESVGSASSYAVPIARQIFEAWGLSKDLN